MATYDVRYPVHLVGSMPSAPPGLSPSAADRDAILTIVKLFADHYDLLAHLPGGERRHAGYVQPTINLLADQLADRGVARVLHRSRDTEGLWRQMGERTRMRLKRPAYGPVLRQGDLDIAALALAEWDAFMIVRMEQSEEHRWNPAWRFQYSVPTPASITVIALGPKDPNPLRLIDMAISAGQIWQFYPDIQDALKEEVQVIHRTIPAAQAVAHIEATAEMLAVIKAFRISARMGRWAAVKMGKLLAAFIASLPPNVAINLHFCTGSLDNRAEATMRDLTPFVALTNETMRALTRLDPQRSVLHVHCPAAPSDAPVRTDSVYFAPLAELELPRAATMYAGLANRHQTLDVQRTALRAIGEYLPGPDNFGVSTSCGLGRYTPEGAQKVLRILRALALGTAEV